LPPSKVQIGAVDGAMHRHGAARLAAILISIGAFAEPCRLFKT